MGTSPKSRRERKKERTRRALLDVALALFARRGIHGTRIEDITDQADLGKGAFYNYFASKDDLVAALLAEAVEILDREYLSPTEPKLAPADRVTRMAVAHNRFFDTHSDYPVLFHQARGLLMLDSSPESPLRAVLQDYLARLAQRLAPPGAVHDPVPHAQRMDAAAALAGAITGYRSHIMAGALPFESGTVIDMLSGGLAARMEQQG